MFARFLLRAAPVLLAAPLGWIFCVSATSAADNGPKVPVFVTGKTTYQPAPVWTARPLSPLVPLVDPDDDDDYVSGYYTSIYAPNYLSHPPYSTGYSPAPGGTVYGRFPYWEVAPTPPLPPPPTATVRVQVPTDAQVWLEGQPTRQTGPVREFETPPLEPGRKYEYQIKASWIKNGRMVSDTQTVTFRAGETPSVTFIPGPTITTVKPAAKGKGQTWE
jgi:uncharacterized protein (TIGR03000 family)